MREQDNNDNELIQSTWKERVYIETAEYIINGDIFIPQIGKRTRIISDILNTNKNFIAVKNCKIESKLFPSREVVFCDFITVNISSILIMRPSDE